MANDYSTEVADKFVIGGGRRNLDCDKRRTVMSDNGRVFTSSEV